MRLLRTQGRFGQRQVDQVILRENAATEVRDVLHVLKQLDALGIVAAGEGEECFAERWGERVFWDP